MIWPLNRAVAIWTDRARRWLRRKFFSAAFLIASLLASAFSATGPAQAEKRIALVIGNSNYQNVPQLANPAADAKAMAQMFGAIGFKVDLQIDVDNLSLKRALRRFEDDANKADMAVIYFAGHGLEVRGVNYLIPIDAKLADERDAPDEAIALDRLVEAVTSATRLGLIILDACRDDPFSIGMKRLTASRSMSRGLARIEPEGAETLIAYAAKAGSTAEDGYGTHSPFTAALLNNLPTPGLDVELAFRRVRDEVLNVTGDRQEPFMYGSLSGKPIYLVPSEKPSGSPPPSDQNSAELLFWTSVKDSRLAADYKAYLARYPNGIFAALAANRIAELERPSSTPAPGSLAVAVPVVPATENNSTIRSSTLIKDPALLGEIRERLYELNFDPGPFDGRDTEAVQQAIREFQKQSNQEPSGIATMGLLSRLRDAGSLKPWGAIVYSENNGKWGMSWDKPTRQAAVASARASCGDAKLCPAEISFFGSGCGAFAHSASGWAVSARRNTTEAKEAALADCGQHGKSCEIVASVCADGTQRYTLAK